MWGKFIHRLNGLSWLSQAKWNMLGSVIPILVAIPCIGLLARFLSTSDFGVFSIAVAVVGYTGYIDVGLGRTITFLTARDEDSLALVQWVLSLGLLVGTSLGSLFALVCCPFLEQSAYSQVLSVGVGVLPLCLAITLFTAYMEGKLLYKQLLWVRAVVGISNYLFPLLGACFLNGLPGALVGLVLSKIVALVPVFCNWEVRRLLHTPLSAFDRLAFKKAISFGGWVAILNIVGPIISYMDRFIIASLAGPVNLAMYSAPNEVASKTNIPQGAVARVLFPLYTAEKEPAKRSKLYRQTVLFNLLISLLIILFVFFARDLIVYYWFGAKYAGCGWVLFILTTGVCLSSVAFVPFACLQSSGRGKTLASMQLAELVVFSALLAWSVQHYSVLGAACAMLTRSVLDGCLLFFFNARIQRAERPSS